MKLSKLIALALAGALVFGAIGCTKGAGSDTIVIGGIGPLTGDLAMYGTFAINGAEMALEEYGEVLGKKIVFSKLDDKGDATEAVNAYNKLVNNEKAVAIIGAVTSKPSAALAATAAKDGIPVISPSATALDVTTYGSNIFRACFIDPYQGEIMANFGYNVLEHTTAAVLYDITGDYSTGLAESFRDTFEANGGTITNFEGYSDGDKDFKAQLTNIAASNPEILFLPDYYGTVSLIAKQVQEVGLSAVLLGADGWDSIHTTIGDPSLIEGAFFCGQYSSDDPERKVQNFIAKYTEKFGEEPNQFAALGYDAAQILITAMEKAGSTDKDKVNAAIMETNSDYVTGNIVYNSERNPIKSASILEIIDGKYELYTKIYPNQ